MASAAGQPGIGVGTWAWGNQFLWGYDPARDDDTLAATFRRCLERELLFFDTADSYGTGRFNGRSEALLGRFALQASPAERQRLCIATKLAPFPWRLGRQGYARAFAASQTRLQGQMKRVQLHWSTARYAPWQEDPLLDGLAEVSSRMSAASHGSGTSADETPVPGLNARAALITRGLAEMSRLGVALGGQAQTFMGLSGLGDLVLTATGALSRNRQVGLLLAQGRRLDEVLASLGHVAEGVLSAPVVLARARAAGVDMPITAAVVEVLEGRLQPAQAMSRLMSREARAEAGPAR